MLRGVWKYVDSSEVEYAQGFRDVRAGSLECWVAWCKVMLEV